MIILRYGRRIFPYLLLALLVLAFYGYIVRTQDQDAITKFEERFNEQQLIQVGLARQSLEDHIATQIQELNSFSNHIQTIGINDNIDIIEEYNEHPVLHAQVIGFKLIASPSQIFSVNEQSMPEAEMLLASQLDEYDSTNPAIHTPFITPAYAQPDGQWYAILIPLTDADNIIIGALGVAIDFSKALEKYIIPIRSGEFGAAWIQDQRGVVLFDHESEIIGQNVADLHGGYAEIQELDKHYLTNYTGVSEYKFTVQRGGATYRKLVAWDTAHFGDQRYTVALSAPDTEISKHFVDSRQNSLIRGGILFILLTVGGLIIFQVQQVDLRHTIDTRTQELETERASLQQEIDIRKEIEARLQQSETIYRLISQISSDYAFIIRVDADGQEYIEWLTEESFTRVTSYSRNDYESSVRKQVLKYAHPEDKPQLIKDMQKLMQGERVISEYRTTKKTGEEMWVQVTRVPEWDDQQKRVVRFYGIGRDITEYKQTQGVLVENERLQVAYEKEIEYTELRRQYLRTIAHEFRTPLTVINTAIALLDRYRDKLTPEKSRKEFNKVVSSVTYLDKMLTELSIIARSEQGFLQFNPSSVNIIALCEDVLESFRQTAGQDYEINLNHELGGQHHFWLDNTTFHYILTNLVSNAIKYSEPDSKIKLDVLNENEHLILKLTDEGIGISEGDQKLIFEPFHRGQNVNTVRGTGLGLSIAKEMIELHNGTITLESEVNQGSTFTITIPNTR